MIEARADTTHRVLWQGPLPTHCQSSFRAEVLALAMAVASYASAYICSENQAAVRIANRLLSEHRDIWLFFLQCAHHSEPGAHRIRWIPAHRDWTALDGRERVLAFFNHQVDLVAKEALSQRVADPQYTSLNLSMTGFTSSRLPMPSPPFIFVWPGSSVALPLSRFGLCLRRMFWRCRVHLAGWAMLRFVMPGPPAFRPNFSSG